MEIQYALNNIRFTNNATLKKLHSVSEVEYNYTIINSPKKTSLRKLQSKLSSYQLATGAHESKEMTCQSQDLVIVL